MNFHEFLFINFIFIWNCAFAGIKRPVFLHVCKMSTFTSCYLLKGSYYSYPSKVWFFFPYTYLRRIFNILKNLYFWSLRKSFYIFLFFEILWLFFKNIWFDNFYLVIYVETSVLKTICKSLVDSVFIGQLTFQIENSIWWYFQLLIFNFFNN